MRPEIADFWTWFRQNAARYSDLEVPNKEERLDEFEAVLHCLHPGLYFEIGGMPGGPKELVITAEGDPSLFPLVEECLADAPALPGWEIVAFKQPGGFELVLDYKGLSVDPATCWFLPLVATRDPDVFGLRVACPAYAPELHDTLLSAVYIVLDSGLGERAAARDVHHLEVAPVPEDPEAEGFIALRELPQYLAWRQSHRGA